MNAEKVPPQETNIDSTSIADLVVTGEVRLMYLPQEVIVTNEDKVHLCLERHLKRTEKRRNWIAPLGICISLIVTLITTNFKDIGFEAETWKAIFIIAIILSSFWLIFSLLAALRSEKIESIIDELKRGSESMVKLVKKN